MIRLSRREFLRLTQRAYHQLPDGIKNSLTNVDITIEERPTTEDMDSLEPDDTLFGVYSGIPLTEREGGAPELPDRISIYRQAILRGCSTRAQVVEEIRITLWHEVGHYLGMSEADLHRLGYG